LLLMVVQVLLILSACWILKASPRERGHCAAEQPVPKVLFLCRNRLPSSVTPIEAA
jgi:hypothetical protein